MDAVDLRTSQGDVIASRIGREFIEAHRGVIARRRGGDLIVFGNDDFDGEATQELVRRLLGWLLDFYAVTDFGVCEEDYTWAIAVIPRAGRIAGQGLEFHKAVLESALWDFFVQVRGTPDASQSHFIDKQRCIAAAVTCQAEAAL